MENRLSAEDCSIWEYSVPGVLERPPVRWSSTGTFEFDLLVEFKRAVVCMDGAAAMHVRPAT